MNWFNYVGLIIMAIIMIPNILYAAKNKDGLPNKYENRLAEIPEQIGRYGCLAFMVFQIPYTYFGFWFHGAFVVYVLVNSLLCVAYLICWALFWNKTHFIRTISLTVLPSCIFLFGGILLANIPLIVFACIFAPCHIFIGCKNAK